MRPPGYESASGLRPASAYVMVGFVLLMVCGKSWILACEEDHHQPLGTEKRDAMPAPDFDIVDRESQALAQSVQRMNLRLSPRSMWQAHTPDEMARKMEPFFNGERSASELLEDFFPLAKAGIIQVGGDEWCLDYRAAQRIEAWAHDLGLDDWLWLVRDRDKAQWRVHWRPIELLSEEARRAAHPDHELVAPIVWTRKLADGLVYARHPELKEREEPLSWREKEALRAKIWKAFLPCADTIAFRGLPPGSVLDLIELLDAESVQKHQMAIEFEHERVYPVRDLGRAGEAWQVLGKWRFIGEPEAQDLAADYSTDPQVNERRARALLDVKHPRGGLEGVAAELLGREEFAFIAPEAATYSYRKSVPVHEDSRRYYFGDRLEDPTPKVFTTLDGELQEYLHRTLGEIIDEHQAAASMGIVVDVESGDVLAVDGRSRFEVSEFLPTWHLFSPGSTFKVVVMTTALDAKVVKPTDEFNTFNGHYPVPGSRRVIREAEGAPTGHIPAWKAISKSVNAVLVQIGMKIPAEHFHQKLLDLGYHETAKVGLGKERAGHLTDLPWKPAYTHASVSFGHELSVTLWQHASALATILRGGVRRPLRLMTGVEWGDEHYRLNLESMGRVFSERACGQVREMMAEGARTGTGRHLAAAELETGSRLEFISKTGTTEKEEGVACLHNEFERNEFNSKLPKGRKDPNFVTFPAMKRKGKPHKGSCYTSSICLSGRVPGEEREVMVLIVVDEPMSRMKFGSDVAGPGAMRVLKEALGLTECGVCVTQRLAFEPSYGYEQEQESPDSPWRMPIEELMDEQGASW